jgi:polyisoprenyl-teichoic acid--peptidoglycan teichoic acid transferase
MSRILLGPISAVLVLALSGCAGLAAGAADEPDANAGRQAATSTRAQKPTPEPTKPPVELADVLGSDGRLTVLILGSDAREGVVGARTDTIIVATIDPTSGKVAMVSLPRDTVNVPIAPGQVYPGRINSLFWDFERASGKTGEALRKTKQALAYAFGIEIDYYALLEFDGLVRLVNSIGGVKITLDEPFIDPSLRLGGKGLRLKAGARVLDGKTALAYARSRHSDSDYERSKRQQQVIAAAGEKVRSRGMSALPSLVEVARKKIVTDIPLRAAPALFQLAMDAKLASPKSVVLAPSRWARQLPGTYTITPRVLEVQKMFDRVFKPISG